MRTKNTFAAFFAAAALSSSLYAQSYLKFERDFAPAAGIESSPLYRKSIAVLGDSYVQNHRRPPEESWHCRLAEKYQMHYYNYGRNGNRMVFPHPKQGTVMLERYTEIPKDIDYIVVIAGHNDANAINRLNGDHAVTETDPLTEQAKAAMLDEFKRGCRRFVTSLKADYPKAKIVFVTPWAVDSPFFPEVIATIKAETAAADVPCYDAASLSGVNPNDADYRRRYFQGEKDTAHLNAEGHRLMLEKIEPFFNALGGR